MKRRLFTLCSAVSLLLCVAASVLWVRSCYVQDFLTWITTRPAGGDFRRTEYRLYSVRGHNVLHVESKVYGRRDFAQVRALDARYTPGDFRARQEDTRGFRFNYNPDVRGRNVWVWLGFRYAHALNDRDPPFPGFTEVRLPHWLVVAVTAVLPAAWCCGRWRRRRRRSAGLCPTCGYDLRASPGRCPECGAAAEGAAA